MLVLTRKLQERIKIGDNVTITVLRVKGNAVRIGIEAPREVRVIRAELPADGAQSQETGEGQAAAEAGANAAAGGAQSEMNVGPVDSESPPAASPLRYPQRRLMNRCGVPPLRVACSQSLLESSVMS